MSSLARNPVSPATVGPTLEQVRFGEFLLERKLISDEQLLDALADHWSTGRKRPIGHTIVSRGFLSQTEVESQAREYHDGDDQALYDALGIVELGELGELGELRQDSAVN